MQTDNSHHALIHDTAKQDAKRDNMALSAMHPHDYPAATLTKVAALAVLPAADGDGMNPAASASTSLVDAAVESDAAATGDETAADHRPKQASDIRRFVRLA